MSTVDTPDMVCCVNCFRDRHIKQFIRGGENIGTCDYCLSEKIDTHSVRDVGQFIMAGFLQRYEDAAHQVPYESREGGYQYPTETITEILLESPDIWGDILDDPSTLLHDLIYDDNTAYVTHHPHGPPPGMPDEIEHWQKFCETVKREKRFTAFLDDKNSDPNDPQNPRNLLSTIANHFFEDHLDYYPPGRKIYRARIKSGSKNYSHEELTSPPLSNTRNSRMSPVGISFFYGGNDSPTCIHEIRPSVGETVVVAEFEVLRPLTILSFQYDMVETTSMFDPSYNYDYDEFTIPFLNYFISDISKPIRDTDSDIEYVPSQVFTEFIKSFDFDWAFTYAGSDKGENDPVLIDGISFPSSLNTGGQNIVLFRGPEISTENTGNKGDAWLLYKNYTEEKITEVVVSSKPVT
ncbi:MAG: RES domain-containing protein [Deltaproteobacteria bacterium]|nr:RES domain-containing protein [Deltaproteobacteria bacterium]